MARDSDQPINISAVLSQNSGTLAQIAEKTNFLSQISTIVRQICPDLPENAWKIANFHNDTIVFEVKSSSWYQRFQFERNRICQALSLASNQQFCKINIKVNPLWAKPLQAKTTNQNIAKRQLSIQTAEQLTEIAQNAPDSLKQSLLRLAKHTK